MLDGRIAGALDGMSGRLSQTCTVVFGAGTPVGTAIVEGLLAGGAQVAAVDATEPRFASITGSDARRCLVFGADVGDEAAVAGVLSELEGMPVRLVFHVLALPPGVPVADLSVEAWDRGFSGCVRGALVVGRCAVPAIAGRGGGCLAYVAQNDARARVGALGTAAHAAVSMLRAAMAVEYASLGVDVRWLDRVQPSDVTSPLALAAQTAADESAPARADAGR